jgi:hypothetical protein
VNFTGLNVTRLAADYSAAVRAAHSTGQLLQINIRNAAESDPTVDHANDWFDANDLMAEAVGLQATPADWSDIAEPMQQAFELARASGYTLSRILVACEFSGRVRNEFAALGHDVMSCDLLPTDQAGPNGTRARHYQGDVRDILNDGWHMMIAFPDCTTLCNSGVKHLVRGGARINPDRWVAMRQGAEFFKDIGEAPIDRIARENPIMHKYARAIVGCRATQFVQPHHYGEDASKRTGLHLKNLPELTNDPADHVAPRIIEYPVGSGKMVKRWANQSPCGADKTSPGPNRWKTRATTYIGIAKAFARQWGARPEPTSLTLA